MNVYNQINWGLSDWPMHLNARLNGGYTYTPEEEQTIQELFITGRLRTVYLPHSAQIVRLMDDCRRQVRTDLTVVSSSLSTKKVSVMRPPIEVLVASCRDRVHVEMRAMLALELERRSHPS